MACERDPLRSDAARWPYQIAQREPEEVPMAIVGGLDIHRRQITYDYLDTTTGETCRGQLSPATRLELRAWCYRRDCLRTWGRGTASLIWDGLVGVGRMRESVNKRRTLPM
jgi:hypothetical protein